jgi:hypothetical protein
MLLGRRTDWGRSVRVMIRVIIGVGKLHTHGIELSGVKRFLDSADEEWLNRHTRFRQVLCD